MNKIVVTREEIQHLPEVHRIIALNKVRKGEWVLADDQADPIPADGAQ
jgi:hypothetical protein